MGSSRDIVDFFKGCKTKDLDLLMEYCASVAKGERSVDRFAQAVESSINNPNKINMDLVKSQETRRMLDRIIGFRFVQVGEAI